MLRHIDGSVKPWQRPGLRRWVGFALLGVLIALSYALLLTSEEAQAKGGKHAPDSGSASGATEGSIKPAREAVGEVNKLANTGGGGGKNIDPLTVRDPAPRADEPVDNGTVRGAARSTPAERIADKATSAVDQLPEKNPPISEDRGSLGEVAGPAREEAPKPAVEPVLNEKVTSVAGLEGETTLPKAEPALEEATTGLPKAEPSLEETVTPETAPVLNGASSETVPVLERATSPVRPVLEETTSTVEPLLGTASSKIEPVLERATAPVNPVLERTASTVEPLLGEANPPVEPALAGTLPAVGPVLDGATPAANAPVSETVGAAARPLGEEAIPVSGPVLEDAAFRGDGTAIGTTAPATDPAIETMTPAVSPGFGEGVVRHSTGPPMIRGNSGAIPASSPTLQSVALAAQKHGALGSARGYDSVRYGPPASSAEPAGARSELFGSSFVIDGSYGALLGNIAAENAREGPPRPFPFELPPATPPAGVTFGSSGAGAALDLLAILALLSIISRAGASSWSNRATFKLGFSLRLAVERPG